MCLIDISFTHTNLQPYIYYSDKNELENKVSEDLFMNPKTINILSTNLFVFRRIFVIQMYKKIFIKVS